LLPARSSEGKTLNPIQLEASLSLSLPLLEKTLAAEQIQSGPIQLLEWIPSFFDLHPRNRKTGINTFPRGIRAKEQNSWERNRGFAARRHCSRRGEITSHYLLRNPVEQALK
jgi:hypothetical protein